MRNIGFAMLIIMVFVTWGTAIEDVRHNPTIVATMQRLRLPKNFEYVAATIKFVIGSLLLLSVMSDEIFGVTSKAGAAAAAAYFFVAVAAHLRVRDRITQMVPAAALTLFNLALFAICFSRYR